MGCGGSKAAVGPAGDEPPAKAIEQQLLAEAGASMVGASGIRALLEELSLTQYREKFAARGWDDIEHLARLDCAGLQGVADDVAMKPGHASRFVEHFRPSRGSDDNAVVMFALPDDDGSPRQSKIISGGDEGMPVEDLDGDGIVPPPSLTQCAPLPALAGQHRPIIRHPCGWLGAHAAAHPGLKRPPTRSYEPEAPTHVGALMSSARLVPPSCHPHATPMPHPCHPHASPSHPHAILMPTPMPSGPCDAV